MFITRIISNLITLHFPSFQYCTKLQKKERLMQNRIDCYQPGWNKCNSRRGILYIRGRENGAGYKGNFNITHLIVQLVFAHIFDTDLKHLLCHLCHLLNFYSFSAQCLCVMKIKKIKRQKISKDNIQVQISIFHLCKK